MQFVQSNVKRDRRQRWQRFWPRSWLVVLVFIQFIFNGAIIGLEFGSMIINIRYSFFFIGFLASFFFIITWLSTLITICCWQQSIGCATCALILNICSIAAVGILLVYDARFLRQHDTCLWPNNLCDDQQLNLQFFGMQLNSSRDINELKFTLIKIQLACTAMMGVTCLIYIIVYVYTIIKVHQKNTVAAPHTIIELGRVQQPPPPYWPEPPRELPPSSEF